MRRPPPEPRAVGYFDERRGHIHRLLGPQVTIDAEQPADSKIVPAAPIRMMRVPRRLAFSEQKRVATFPSLFAKFSPVILRNSCSPVRNLRNTLPRNDHAGQSSRGTWFFKDPNRYLSRTHPLPILEPPAMRFL